MWALPVFSFFPWWFVMIFKWDPSIEWRVISLQAHEGGYNYTLPGARFTFTLRRKPYYYLLTIIVPTMVLALLSALTFLVPIDSGEKLSLGISILLAFSVLVLIVSEITPQTSHNAPVIGMDDQAHAVPILSTFFHNFVYLMAFWTANKHFRVTSFLWGRVTHICVRKPLVQIMACRLVGTKPLSNQYWIIVNSTLRNKNQWNLHLN